MGEQTERVAGRFRIIGELGKGAAATVYDVVDERLGVRRALKRLSPTMTRYARMRARLVSEARAMARLSHPNVVRVLDVFIDNDDACIVMELVEGGSLVQLLEQHGPLPPLRAVALMTGILEALQAAHEAGIIHRDIKPHNVLLDAQGSPRVTDFGVARLTDEDEQLTRTGVTMGTWAFMAPEQRSDAKSVDHRADIYSAGATLFALLTATTPRDLFAIDLDPALISDIPGPLAPVIQRATRYHRDDRYRSADEMIEALKRAVDQLDPEATILPVDVAPAATVTVAEDVPAPRLSDGSATIPGILDDHTSISPADDKQLAPPPPLPYRRSINVAQLVGIISLLALAAAAWPAILDLIPATLSETTAEPALIHTTPAEEPEPAPIFANIQNDSFQTVQHNHTRPIPEAVAPIPEEVAPIPEEVAPIPEEVAPIPEAVAPIPEEVALIPEEVASTSEVHAPVPEVVLEESVVEFLDGPARIVPGIDGPARLGPEG